MRIARLWRQHCDRPFPPGARGKDVDDVDLILLDADISGCVDSWLSSSGGLDPRRLRILQRCLSDVKRILPKLTDPTERMYYSAIGELGTDVMAQNDGT